MRIPLWIDAGKLNVLVVGGGRVGSRRAKTFLKAGARVKVVSLEFSDELVSLSKESSRLELIRLDVGKEDFNDLIEWADIVVIATSDPKANATAKALARKRGKLVNDATDAADTDVVVPYFTWIDELGVSVAVTSEGRSGVVARKVLERVVNFLKAACDLKTLYEVMWRVKPVLKRLIPNAGNRIPIYYILAEDEGFNECVSECDISCAFRRASFLISSKLSKLGVKMEAKDIERLLKSVKKPIIPYEEQG
ncbi:MAG: NAD(P)-dependent oxidoreductase [Thermoproteota archaeon]